jgi:hypothetical protein
LLVLVLLAGTAHAQTPVASRPAFSVERFTPAPGRAGFGAVEEPDVLPARRWAASWWSSFMTRPIVFRSLVTGDEATVPVRWRLGFDAGAAIGLGARYQVGVAIPFAVQDGDRLQDTGISDAALQHVVLGDIRLHGRMRLAGAPGDRGMAAALCATWYLPTGDDDDFAGEKGTMFDGKLAIGWRGAWLAVAANLGVRFRTKEVVLLSPARPHGDELLTGIAATARLPDLHALGLPRAWAIGEAVWAIGDERNGSRGPSPGELRGGLRLLVADGWSVTALAGAGVTPADVGSPAWRAVLGVSYDRAPLEDSDGDGIIDGRDRCRHAAEDRDGFRDGDGCPEPDNDGDGILDEVDRCPLKAEDFDDYEDADGCPDTETRVPLKPVGSVDPPPLDQWLDLAK